MHGVTGQSWTCGYKAPLARLLEELGELRDKLQPAFPNTIQWFFDSSLFFPPSRLTLTELVPQKGVRRLLGYKHVALATFTQETLFRSAVLEVLDRRMLERVQVAEPTALYDCAASLARKCNYRDEVRVKITAQ